MTNRHALMDDPTRLTSVSGAFEARTWDTTVLAHQVYGLPVDQNEGGIPMATSGVGTTIWRAAVLLLFALLLVGPPVARAASVVEQCIQDCSFLRHDYRWDCASDVESCTVACNMTRMRPRVRVICREECKQLWRDCWVHVDEWWFACVRKCNDLKPLPPRHRKR